MKLLQRAGVCGLIHEIFKFLEKWHNFRRQILPQEKILAILILTWILKENMFRDSVGLREQWAHSVRVVDAPQLGNPC